MTKKLHEKQAGLVGGSARLLGRAASSAGGVLQRGATENPFGFMMATGMGVPMLATLQNPLKDPNKLAKGVRARQLIASTTEPPMKVGLASSVLSSEDLAEALRIYRYFEKQAARRIPVPEEELVEMVEDAWRSVKNVPALHPSPGKTKGNVRERLGAALDARMSGERAVRETATHARQQELHGAQKDKIQAEYQKLQEEIKNLQGRGANEQAMRELQEEQLRLARERETRETQAFKSREQRDTEKSRLESEKAQREREMHERQMKAPDAWSPARIAALGLGVGAASTVVGAGSQGMMHGVGLLQEKVRALGQDKRFRAVVAADPSLRERPEARQYFQLLDRMAPSISGEPLLAASALQVIMDQPPVDPNSPIHTIRPDMLQQIFRAEEGRQATRFPNMPKGPVNLRDISLLTGG